MFGSTLLQLDFLARTRETQLDRWRAQPMEGRAIESFAERAREIRSLDDFMRDDQVYKFVMKAYGLDDFIFAKAMIRKMLEEGTSDPGTMANRMVDPRFRELTKDLGFDTFPDGTKVRNPAFIERTIDRYVVSGFEMEQGERNIAVRLALYFERKAPQITSWYQVLGDKALSEVIRTGLGLPPSMAAMDVDRQVDFLEKRMSIEDLQDPGKVKSFIRRFAALYDAQNGGAPTMNLTGPAALIAPISPSGPPPILSIDPTTIAALNFYRSSLF